MKTRISAVFLAATVFVALGSQLCAQTHKVAVEVKVFEPGGQPVNNATVIMGLPRYAQGADELVTAFTDSSGIAKLEGEVPFDFGVSAKKNGYYDSTAPKVSLVSETDIERVTKAVQRVEIELKPIKKPVAMLYGGTRTNSITLPSKGDPVGYDLLVGDWVAPWGKGRVTDLLFQVSGKYESRTLYNRTLTVQFPAPASGMMALEYPAGSGSEFKFPYEAPVEGYIASHTWHRTVAPDKQDIEHGDSRRYLIRFRTEFNEDGTIKKALYGLIWDDLEFFPGPESTGVKFNYAVNPAGERNIEFDKKTSRRVPGK
jgi:hypothetical protein